MKDNETLQVYDQSVARYADTVKDTIPAGLAELIAILPKGARVLDLGCGTGEAAKQMVDAGLVVDAVDGSSEMVRHVRETHGVDARQMFFDDLDARDCYDAAWVSFSLLHAPKQSFPAHLMALHAALRAGGRLVLGMKLGSGEHRDSIGRRYAYYSVEELNQHLADAGFAVLDSHTGEGKGLSGSIDPFVVITAHA